MNPGTDVGLLEDWTNNAALARAAREQGKYTLFRRRFPSVVSPKFVT